MSTRKLEATNLKKSYQGRYAVRGISLEVTQGQVVGLLGPNGAGKTTAFYMIAGVQRPEEGTVLLDGQNITSYPMHKRAKSGLGYLSQERSIFRKLTVEENLNAVLEMLPLSRTEKRERLESLLNELRIQHVRKIKGYALSGGESRRAEIARALVLEPTIMLLDEPFSSLDSITRSKMQEWVSSILINNNKSVVLVTHDIAEAVLLSDRVLIMGGSPVKICLDYKIDISRPRDKSLENQKSFNKCEEDINKELLKYVSENI